MAGADGLVRQLNRRARRPSAKLTFEGDTPFGPTLRLRSYTLGNGLELLLVVDRSAPVVSYHTWYRVGSRDEVVGKTGLAHMLEHLMFGGTERRAHGEFDKLCEQAGAEANAATWTDWTNYYENLPKASLALAMELEADRMVGLDLNAPEFESEREVVENERSLRVDDDVEGSAGELLYELAFREHPYRWPTIGSLEDIRGYRLGDVKRFYRRWYAPNNATVVIVGDFDEQTALELAQAHYGGIEAARLPKRRRVTEPEQLRARRRTLRKPTSTEKLQLGFHAPALGTDDYAALMVLSEILLGGRSSRVHKRLVHELELANEARGGIAPFGDPGLFDIFVSMREGHSLDEGLAVLDEQFALVRSDLVRDDELEKAQNRLELGFLEGMESASGKAEQIGFYRTVLGDTSAVFGHLEAYRRVDAERVRDVAKRYLTSRRQNLVRILPDDGRSS